MSISDSDFICFYQSLLVELWAEGGDLPCSLIGFPRNDQDIAWYQQALDAMTRLTSAGLAEFREKGLDNEGCLRAIIARQKTIPLGSGELRFPYFLYETEKGSELIVRFRLKENGNMTIAPGFREALGRIFDEHGVGFDAELPYKMQF